MRKIFHLPHYSVQCSYIGVVSGGFSEKLNPEVAKKNMNDLIKNHQSTYATRIIPGVDYDARIASLQSTETATGSLVTDKMRHTLTLRPADCIPLVLFSQQKPVVSLIHCGRKELDADIIRKTVNLLSDEWGIKPVNLTAFLGPGIKRDSYLLPTTIKESLGHEGWNDHMYQSGEKVALDLFGFAVSELRNLGVRESNIEVSPIDTAKDPLYFSYFATRNNSKQAGLNGFAVTLLPR